ncbi:MAG: FtsQ-type POTRA domain-containing protein [Bacilli bacterium]|nr:FtsQ-type POTRA domain-containing protein [Bacilli bacterium]
MKKPNKPRINKIALVVIILFVYLVFSFGYYLWSLPIKNIYIFGNTYLSDATIIETSGIKNYPSLMKVSRRKIRKKLKQNEFIDDVSIKKNVFGKITITVKESKPLFINRSTNKIVLLNGKSVDDNINAHIPTLINNVPNDVYEKLIERFNEVDYNIILQISEIEYSPNIINEKVIDAERFYLRMNDGNSVYINPINIKRLNNYFEAYDYLPDGAKGTFYFDSNSNNIMFKIYGSKSTEEVVINE